MELIAEWTNAKDSIALGADQTEVDALDQRAEEQALEEIKTLHASMPKYRFNDRSQAEIIQRYSVNVINLKAVYLRDPSGKKAQVLHNGEPLSAEGFVSRHLEGLDYSVLAVESRPFHVIFGIFLWALIQDPEDPLNRPVSFGDRQCFEEGKESRAIWTVLPQDFGTPSYGRRREASINQHLGPEMNDRNELLRLFDYWQTHSDSLRQYLWAHRKEDIDVARKLIGILPTPITVRILRYLVADYWGHYIGWPDLLAYKDKDYVFVEVKSSGDKLSDHQKRWIKDNYDHLKLPFSLVKIHKVGVLDGHGE